MENNSSSKPLLLDISQNSSSLHIAPAIYVRILQKAVEQTSQDIKEIESALPVSDYEKMQTISHKLKGDYDNLRITMLSLLAKQINDMAKAQQDSERIVMLLDEFVAYFEQLKQIVAKAKVSG